MNRIFNPALRVMDRLTYPRKIILLGSIAILTIIILFTALYGELNKKILESRLQLKGIEKISIANNAIQLSQKYRGLSSAMYYGDDLFYSEYITVEKETEIALQEVLVSLDTDELVNFKVNNLKGLERLLPNLKKNHRNSTLEEDFIKHTHLVDQLRSLVNFLGDEYRLITDRDIVSYYLIDDMLNNTPQITENMGQLRGVVLGILSGGKLSSRQRDQLIALESHIEIAFNDFEYNFDKITRTSPETGKKIANVYASFRESKSSLLDIVHNDIIPMKFTTDSVIFYKNITAEIDNIYKLMHDIITPNLVSHIENRIAGAVSTLNFMIMVAGLLLAATLYFLIGLYLSLVRNIGYVNSALSDYANGNLDKRVYLKTKDEMLTVSKAFNNMADRFKLVLEENKKEKNAADKANKAKSEFLSSMSHELRTPLNAILGFSQLLIVDKGQSFSDQQKEWMNYIMSGGDHLMVLINDVLELSAIEAGKLELSIEPVNLRDMADDAVHLTASLSTNANIPVSVKSNLDITVRADHTKLSQIFINLLSNAIKYNRANGSVSISWKLTGKGTVRISVTDTGIGISKANQSKVFDAFSRIGQEYSDIEGTGIGLVVTKNLVELMGGKMGFDSVEHKGTTFWFELYTEDAPRTIDALDTPDVVKILDTPIIPHEDRKTVLYVEDNVANRDLIDAIFEDWQSYNLKMAETAEIALDMALEEDFDLLLIDINLPGMNGRELTRKLRKIGNYKHAPIIAMTGAAMAHDIEAAEGLFDEYITKPMNIDQLHEYLKKYLD